MGIDELNVLGGRMKMDRPNCARFWGGNTYQPIRCPLWIAVELERGRQLASAGLLVIRLVERSGSQGIVSGKEVRPCLLSTDDNLKLPE